MQEQGAGETLLCRGEYRHFVRSVPTGKVEQWRIGQLPDGGLIVRAELSDHERNRSLLAQFKRRADGRPEWLRMRYRVADCIAAAQYTFEEAQVRVERQVKGDFRRREIVELANGYEVDYHAVIGYDCIWRGYPRHARGKPWSIPIFRPGLQDAGGEMLAGEALRLSAAPLETEPLSIPAGDFEVSRRFTITQTDGSQLLAWYDESGIPLRWHNPDADHDFVLVRYTRLG